MLSNDINPDDFKGSEADKYLMVKFYFKSVEDKTASKEAGHPMFVEKEYIEIRVPGKRDPQVARPAHAGDKSRFPEHYRRFKDRVEQPETGWPLVEWNGIPRSYVDMLAFHNIKTVEQLASAPDSAVGAIQGCMTFKQKAQEALANAADGAQIADRQRELEKENEALRADNADLGEKVDKLSGQLSALLDKLGDTESASIAPSELDKDKTSDAEEKETEAQAGEEKVEDEKPKRRSRAKS